MNNTIIKTPRIGALPKALLALMSKYSHIIRDTSDERGDDNGIWIYLHDEYEHEIGNSCIHEGYTKITAQDIKYIKYQLQKALDSKK